MRPHRITLLVLTVLGLLNLGRGGIHLFAPDSGAASIAGFDLSGDGGLVIIALLAGIGAQQIAIGVVDLAVALKYRSLGFALIGFHVFAQALVVLAVVVLKPLPGDPPGEKGALAILLILAATLVVEVLHRRRG